MLHFCARFPVVYSLIPNQQALLSLFSVCFISAAAWGQGITFAGSAPAVNFGSVNVCPAGQTAPAPCTKNETLTYKIAAGTTIGSIVILTTGVPNLDYKARAKDTSTTLCTAKLYTAQTTCSVDVTFAPSFPGSRNGGVVIKDGSGVLLSNTYIYGVGNAPQAAFNPARQLPENITGLPFLNGPPTINGMAVDAAGNVYTSSGSGPVGIQEFIAVNGVIPPKPQVKMLGGGIYYASTLRVDGSGNIYVDAGGIIKKIPAGCTSADCVTTLPLPYGVVGGFAVDGSGNVFASIVDNDPDFPSPSEIVEYPSGCSSTDCITLVNDDISAPGELTVDASGNLFVIDGAIYEIVAQGGYNTVKTLKTTLSGLRGINLDAAGDIYVTTAVYLNGVYRSYVEELLAVNGQIPAKPKSETVVNTSPNFPVAMTIAPTGSLYFSFYSTGIDVPAGVVEVEQSQPAALDFPAASVGSTSTPQVVSVHNVGNRELSLSSLSVTTNFSLVAGSGTPPDCTDSTVLNSDAECDLNISYTPTSASPLTGSVSLTDDTLNANPSMAQVIELTGFEPPLAEYSASELDFNYVAYPDTKILPLTITNVGDGTLTVAASINGPSYLISGNTCASGVPAGASCNLQVELKPVAIGNHDDQLTIRTNGVNNPIIPLTGRSIGIGPSVDMLQFGTIGINTTRTLALTIHDFSTLNGPHPVTFSINGPSYQVISGSTCVAPGPNPAKSCTVQIEFAPSGAGMHKDLLTVTPDTGASSTVSLVGNASPIAPTAPGPLTFPTIAVGSTETLPLTIQNYGAPGSPTLAVSINGPSFKVLRGSTCMTTGIASGQTCTLQVEFAPASSGKPIDTMTLTPSSGAGAFTVTLSGQAATP